MSVLFLFLRNLEGSLSIAPFAVYIKQDKQYFIFDQLKKSVEYLLTWR